jgi:hypothetical protein
MPRQRACEIGKESVGSKLGEAPIHVNGLLRRDQRLLAAPEIGKADAEHAKAVRNIGEHSNPLSIIDPLARINESVCGARPLYQLRSHAQGEIGQFQCADRKRRIDRIQRLVPELIHLGFERGTSAR